MENDGFCNITLKLIIFNQSDWIDFNFTPIFYSLLKIFCSNISTWNQIIIKLIGFGLEIIYENTLWYEKKTVRCLRKHGLGWLTRSHKKSKFLDQHCHISRIIRLLLHNENLFGILCATSATTSCKLSPIVFSFNN